MVNTPSDIWCYKSEICIIRLGSCFCWVVKSIDRSSAAISSRSMKFCRSYSTNQYIVKEGHLSGDLLSTD